MKILLGRNPRKVRSLQQSMITLASPSPSVKSPRTKFILPQQIIIQRHDTLVSYARSLRCQGMEQQEIVSLLFQANRERCDPPISPKRTRSEFQGIAKWVCQFPPGVSSREMTEEKQIAIETAEKLVLQYQWKGKIGHTCRYVALEMLMFMGKHGDPYTVASCRDIALILGISYNTTARCLRLLSGVEKHAKYPIPAIFKRKPDNAIKRDEETLTVKRHAYLYKLVEEEELTKIAHTQAESGGSLGELRQCAIINVDREQTRTFMYDENNHRHLHDAFRGRKGLSLVQAEVYRILEQGSVNSSRYVAQTIGMSQQTARYSIQKLHDAGLVEKQGKWWTKSSKLLDEVALDRGTFGHYALQKAEYAWQRQQYNARLIGYPTRKKSERPLNMVPVEAPDPVWEELLL